MKYENLSEDAVLICTKMVEYAELYSDMGQHTSHQQIYSSLHSALDALGLPRGEERSVFISGLRNNK